MTDQNPISSRRMLFTPHLSRTVESWPGRILSWIYPSRGWGRFQRAAEAEPAVDHAKKTRPTPGKPAGMQIGETR